MKYYAHIISHSHWDREWYMPYESHHMKLIDLIDDVLKQIKTDNKFKSFHLDGHVLGVYDYLEVRPEKKDELIDAVTKGKIKIGPWYVLQDAFLTSCEANIRNLQYGIKLSKKLGGCQYVGYYPDTFGIYSQAAQILKKANIDNMYFGRGVSPTGFNNQVSENFSSQFSEMIIKAPNGDEVMGILFANWYSNANEIPLKNAKPWWDEKLRQAKKYAKTSHLLFMNGCDHQPLQKDITKAIDVANGLYDDVEFIHSNLSDYYNAVNDEVFQNDLDVIKGELKSQNTDGYYTLINTSSSRVLQKIKNSNCQDLLEKYVEPLSTMLNNYDHDKIEYGWKKLMQNHPHDSICGCSCDSVHDGMDTRFEDVLNISEHIIRKNLEKFKEQGINYDGNTDHAFTIFNPLSVTKSHHSQKILLTKFYFDEHGYQKSLKLAKEFTQSSYQVVDAKDNIICSDITNSKIVFNYDLPNEAFRKPYYANQVIIDLDDNVTPYSHKSYFLVKKENQSNYDEKFCNEYYEVSINKNGSFTLKDEKNCFKEIGMIFDQGDIGNEYMFGRVKDDEVVYVYDKSSNLEYVFKNTYKQCILNTNLITFKSANEADLENEKLELKAFYARDTKRSHETIKIPIKIIYQLDNNSKFLSIKIKFINTAGDHRVRMRFNFNHEIKSVNVDSIFDVVNRSIEVSKYWKNECNDQQFSKFISVKQNNCNFVVATSGLHEYEAAKNHLDITLLRSVSEMGDWGVFNTPKAQLINQQIICDLNVGIFYDEYQGYNEARLANNKTVGIELENLKGLNNPNKSYLSYEKDQSIIITSLKKNDLNETIMRMFALKDSKFVYSKEAYVTDLLEHVQIKKFDEVVNNREIVTLKI